MAKHKLVDTWYYDVKDLAVPEEPRDPNKEVEDGEEEEPPRPPRIITKKVEVQVRLDKETLEKDGPPYALKRVEFVVSCDDPKIELHGHDIEALRQATWEFLDEKFKIKWTNYFLVTVGHATDYGGGRSTGLTFGYKDVEKGLTWDGKELLREYEYNAKRVIRPWPGRFTDKGGRAIACIEVTEANKAAVEEFARRVDKLREMIRDTLKPEVIMQTLANLTTMALLPPAPDKGPDDED